MNRPILAPAPLIAVLLAGTSPAFGQAPRPPVRDQATLPTFTDRTEVVVGNVDVTVLDGSGGPVIDLTPSDFVLWVDGRLTEISHFALVSPEEHLPFASAERFAAPPPLPRPPPPEPRVLVILIDNPNTQLFNRNYMLTRLIEYVSDALRPPDRAMVVVYDQYLRFVTGLTPEHDEIIAALEEIRSTGRNVGANHALLLSMIRQAAAGRGDPLMGRYGEGSSMLTHEPTGGMLRMNAEHLRNETRRTLGAFKVLLRTMSGVRGRKSLIYVSDGLAVEPGVELVGGGSRSVSIEEMAARGGILELARWASAADVALYTFDARGLIAGGALNAAEHRTSVPPSVESTYIRNYQDSLIVMAELTGGLAVVNTNELGAGLQRIERAMKTYYSIGFPLESTGRDAARDIRVALREGRGLEVSYRRLLVERSTETRVVDRTIAGLAFGLSENRLGLRVQLGAPEPLKKKRFRVPIAFLVPGERLALIRNGAEFKGYVRVYAIAEGPEGKRSPLAEDRFTIAVPEEEIAALATLELQTAIEIEEGVWRVSFGVLDEQGGETGYTLGRIAAGT